MKKEYILPEKIKKSILENKDNQSFYLYDLETIEEKVKKLSFLPKNVKTFFAMKANPNIEVVKKALDLENIFGIEIASKGEAEIVLKSKEKNLEKVIYTGPSKKDDELEFCIKNNILYLNIESFKEALVINEKAKEKGIVQKVLMRLNTKHKFDDNEAGVVLGSGDTQFGFPQEKAEKYLKKLEKLENISVEGFHMYPATGVLKSGVLLKSVKKTFEFILDIEKKLNKEFKTIDFGGGFGVDYGGFEEFDVLDYANGLKKLIEEFSFENKELILELGRYIVADMGYFVTKVNDIKTLASGKKAVLCMAGTNAIKRPQVLNVDYHVDIVENFGKNEEKIFEKMKNFEEDCIVEKNDLFNVYGPFCTSVDKILWDKIGKKINLGDFIVIPQAGAYGLTMSPGDFLSHPKVPEIIIN